LNVLGIDVSKADFHAWLLQSDGHVDKRFANNAGGFGDLRKWLQTQGSPKPHVCMESTGNYFRPLATALFEADIVVSVVNPRRTLHFAKSLLQRTKTDKADAQMIARFCLTQRPAAWAPARPEILEIRGLLSYRHQLVGETTRLKQIVATVEVNKQLRRLHEAHLTSAQRAIAVVEKQLRQIVAANRSLSAQVAAVEEAKGFGFLTAITLVAHLPIDRLRSPKAAAAFVGLSPREHQSGTSINGKPRICKAGNAQVRAALFMPAQSAKRFNPILAAFAARLEGRNKPSKVVTVAVMRKMVVLAYSRLKALEAKPVPAA